MISHNAQLSVVVTSGILFLSMQVACAAEPVGRSAVLIENGHAHAALFVPARLLDDAAKNPEPPSVWRSLKAEDNRRRLREAVKDLAAILERITGARLEIVKGKPAPKEKRLPILIGELAIERFGRPAKTFPYGQGFRLVVSPDAVGLMGESDLATSYAIYTLLDQLGCRWYMPSSKGEVLPSLKTVAVKEQDLSTGPYTIYRGLWYCDNDFARRNRLGGLEVLAGHNLEFVVPKELRKSHPEIRAVINGKPHDHLVKWTHPLVAEAVANACLAKLAADRELHSYSLSPDDGSTWDESDDAKHDADDFDPAAQAVSKTDRLMVFANRVAKKVSAKHTDVKLGILAYADYIRPPVREKVHPNLVPQIAPITFSRAHPMNDDGEPNNKVLRALVEGWAKCVPATSYYFYAYNLAELSSPNPMIAKWSHDIPYIYAHGACKYWQPETTTNFETSLHANYLGMRLAWEPAQDPAAIIRELHEKFYGNAAKEMAEYWTFLDEIWTKTPEYSGCGFGHLRRFTPERMAKARQLLDRAAAACRTESEKFRIKMASDSLGHFEQFVQMRRDLAEGRLHALAAAVKAYRERLIELGNAYTAQFAFAKMDWTGKKTVNVIYFDAFYKKTYDDAARLASGYKVLTKPLRQWRYQPDRDKKGEAAGWAASGFKDADWKTTDCAVETWSTLGLHNYMGPVWYRTRSPLAELPAGKKVFLWVGATDGRVKVFVNGTHVPYRTPKAEKADTFAGYCEPASFDITAAVKGGAENQITLLCTRETLNELGTGGLLAPVILYREQD